MKIAEASLAIRKVLNQVDIEHEGIEDARWRIRRVLDRLERQERDTKEE